MLSTDGEVWQTGTTCRSGFDERSLPAWEGSDVPTRVEGALAGLTATQIAAGTQHAAVIAGPALGQASQMYTWGRGVEGQLGREAAGHDASLPHTSPNCPEPVLVKHLEGRKFVQVFGPSCHMLPATLSGLGQVAVAEVFAAARSHVEAATLWLWLNITRAVFPRTMRRSRR